MALALEWTVEKPRDECLRLISQANGSRFFFVKDVALEVSIQGYQVRAYGRYQSGWNSRGFLTCLDVDLLEAPRNSTRIVCRGRFIWPLRLFFGFWFLAVVFAVCLLAGIFLFGPGKVPAYQVLRRLVLPLVM